MATYKYHDFILRFTDLSYAPQAPREEGLASVYLGLGFGESLGLVADQNSGASTLRDLLFGKIQPDQGQIMYYGRSIDELAPYYVGDTYRHLLRERKKLEALQHRLQRLRQAFRERGEEEAPLELREKKERAERAFFKKYHNLVQLQGGFIQLDPPDILAPYFIKRYDLALEYKEIVAEIEGFDAEYRDLQKRYQLASEQQKPAIEKKIFSLSETLNDLQTEIIEVQWELEEVLELIDSWKEPYLEFRQFQRHEQELDEAIDLFRLTPAERRSLCRDLQYVPSLAAGALDALDTFADVLEAGLVIQGLFTSGRASTRDYLAKLMQFLGLDPGDLDRKVGTADAETQFLLLLGRSLALHPKLLYLEEPLLYLTDEARERVTERLLSFQEDEGLSFIVASSDPDTLLRLTDRCAVLCEGHLVELFDTGAMVQLPFHPYTAAFFAPLNIGADSASAERFSLEVGPGDGTDYASEHCPFLRRCKFSDERCLEPPPLVATESGHFYACHHTVFADRPRRI